MTNTEKLQALIIDLETVLKHRDGFLHQIRTLDLEMELIGNHTMDGPHKEDAEEHLKALRTQLLQADEYLRASHRKMAQLSGKGTPDEVRVFITELKVALNKIAEANGRVASAKADFSVYNESESEDIRNIVVKELAESQSDLEKYESYAFSLVPDAYVP